MNGVSERKSQPVHYWLHECCVVRAVRHNEAASQPVQFLQVQPKDIRGAWTLDESEAKS